MDQPLQCLRLLLGELGPHKRFLVGRGMKTAIGCQQSPHFKTVHLREQDSEARRSLGEHYLPDEREELGAEGGRAHGQGCRESVGEHRGVGNNGDRARRGLC